MKSKFTLEYSLNCPPIVIYPRLSTPGGLSEWFADNVNVEGKYLVFFWDNSSQKAEIIQKRDNVYIRFKWVDDSENTFFEFRLVTDELTGDNALIITDFAEEDEKKDAIDLWDSQISALKHCIGV
jgi:uncharacterized protein YndB with AHSA1/START domain